MKVRGKELILKKVRFNSKYKINNTTGCWNWIASKDYRGYGKFDRGWAHRASYELFIGKIPEGLCVLHKCDNPSCVNPNHLFLGTRGDNQKDMANKKRSQIGEKHHNCKLSYKDITDIKVMSSFGVSSYSIAQYYPVSARQIRRIIQGTRWDK